MALEHQKSKQNLLAAIAQSKEAEESSEEAEKPEKQELGAELEKSAEENIANKQASEKVTFLHFIYVYCILHKLFIRTKMKALSRWTLVLLT